MKILIDIEWELLKKRVLIFFDGLFENELKLRKMNFKYFFNKHMLLLTANIFFIKTFLLKEIC